MQYNLQVPVKSVINDESLTYAYDSREEEIMLESGYKYTVYTLDRDGHLITSEINLEEESNAV